MFDNIFFKINLILNNYFWWLSYNFNVFNIEFWTFTKIIIFLIILFYIFSLINLYKRDLDIISLTKIFIKNTILFWLTLFFVFKIQWWNNINIITTNCYDKQYATENIWITNEDLTWFDSKRFWIIEEKLSVWNYDENIYCKLKNIITKVKYKKIQWNIDKKTVKKINEILKKYKIEELKNKELTIKRKLQTIIFNNWDWIIWKNNSYNNEKWHIYYNWKKYLISSLTTPIKWTEQNLAIINYSNVNDFLLIGLYDYNNKKINFIMINSPLNDKNIEKKIKIKEKLGEKIKEINFLKQILWDKKEVTNYILYISFINNGIYNIKINNKNYYTMAKVYQLLYNYDNWKIPDSSELKWLVWVNIWFHNWKMFSKQDYKIYDLNLTTNSFYYRIVSDSLINPYNTNILTALTTYVFYYIITFLSLFSLLILFFILIK